MNDNPPITTDAKSTTIGAIRLGAKPPITDPVDDAIILMLPVIKELITARLKFPNWPNDPLHAVAILQEEAGELMKAVLEHTYEPYKSSREDVRKEAIQTAAMCFRFLASFDRYDFAPCVQHRQDK